MTVRDSETPRAACERVQARLCVLLDGELAPLEAARDEGHLEACASCAAERAAWERTLGSARAVEAARADDGLAAALLGLDERLARVPVRRTEGVPDPGPVPSATAPRPRALLLWPLAAAAAAVVALVALEHGGVDPLGRTDRLAEAVTPRFELRLPTWNGLFDGERAR